MFEKIILRLFFNLILFLSIFLMPFYFQLFLVLLALVFFSFYWEIIIWAGFLDLIYGTYFYTFNFFYLLGALVALVIIEGLKKNVFR